MVDVDPAHLDRPFDYRIPPGASVAVGHRVRVRFSGRVRTGWVVGLTERPDVEDARVADLEPRGDIVLFDEEDLRWWRWVADRYAAPLAHVLRHAIPARVAAVERDAAGWDPPAALDAASVEPVQRWSSDEARRLLALAAATPRPGRGPAVWWRPPPDDPCDALAVDLVAAALAAGRGAVVLAPDPRSPLLEAVSTAFRRVVGDHRSARADRTRYRAYVRGRTGHVRVAVGERAAVFAPVGPLGLVIVDDEANRAYKERRSPRHHVREVALARARFAGALCVLRCDLPSAPLWRLLGEGHVERVVPDRGRERAARPRVDVVDLGSPRPGTRRARLSVLANRALGEVVATGGQAIVLAARGGTGAALACTRCGQRRPCPRCAASVRPDDAVAGSDGGSGPAWRCPSCGWRGPPFACAVCGATVVAPLAAGAARLAAELARAHPRAQVVRMEGFDAAGPTRRPAIAVMTRGSVVDDPGWLAGAVADLVVAPDADGMLRRASVDAAEDALRLWLAAARLAGRVIVQTREPSHHAVQALVRWDPEGFWAEEARTRSEAGFPPARSLVRVDGPSDDRGVAGELRDALGSHGLVLGPDPSGASLVVVDDLRAVLPALRGLRDEWDRDGRGVRIDVDPVTGW